jgi:hypothetical protein
VNIVRENAPSFMQHGEFPLPQAVVNHLRAIWKVFPEIQAALFFKIRESLQSLCLLPVNGSESFGQFFFVGLRKRLHLSCFPSR